jgi:hypothetical protein
MALNVNDVGVIRLMMEKLVTGYTPSDEIWSKKPRLKHWVWLDDAIVVIGYGQRNLGANGFDEDWPATRW